MNGGVIFESNPHSQLHSGGPVLKQELLTEHYAITAKRPSIKDKERMNRPPKINTTATYQVDALPPQFSAPVYPTYPTSAPQAGYYQQQQEPYYVYPQGGPVPGPSRRQSQPSDMTPQPMYQAPFQYEPVVYHPPQGQGWDNASVVSTASVSSSHKRKRSSSSQVKDELRTPRKTSMASLASDIAEGGATKRRLPTGASSLPTPPSTGGHNATLSGGSVPSEKAKSPKHGVFVTNTAEEGRKLGLVQTSSGSETVHEVASCGPPRTTAAPAISVNDSGVATVGSANVLRSDLEWLEKDTPQTPTPGTPKSQVTPGEQDDTPRTKEQKVKRRISAFNVVSRPLDRMFSIRLDMGQGQPTRVALRKDLALAFIGFDKATHVVEERRGEDEESWAAVNGSERAPVRPDWPDDEAPWKHGCTRLAKQLREDKERNALLQRYLETSSDDEDDDDGAARFPNKRTRDARARPVLPPVLSAQAQGSPSDARAALLSTLNRGRRPGQSHQTVTPIINCVCKQPVSNGSMISCNSCKTWHHLGCVGLEDVQLAPTWSCNACVHQARRATLATPSARTPPSYLNSNERSATAFRGNQALALAPSPMFAGEAARAAGTVNAQTPFTPSRRQRARVLSYGNDLWGVANNDEAPSTPMPSARQPDRFSTPRADDPVFDVNSTPSRHLSTDPRMAGQFTGSLFSMTPLVGRSRVPSTMLIAGDTPQFRGRNVSGNAPFSDTGVTSRHEFLQTLTADARRAPFTDGPGSPSIRRNMLGAPVSPSPYGSLGALGHRRVLSSNKFSHLRSSSSSLSLGTAMEADEAGAREEKRRDKAA